MHPCLRAHGAASAPCRQTHINSTRRVVAYLVQSRSTPKAYPRHLPGVAFVWRKATYRNWSLLHSMQSSHKATQNIHTAKRRFARYVRDALLLGRLQQ